MDGRALAQTVLANKAYSDPSRRAALRQRGIAFTSFERRDQIRSKEVSGTPRMSTPGAMAASLAARETPTGPVT